MPPRNELDDKYPDIVPLRLKVLLEEPEFSDEETRERARKQIKECEQIEQRDEYEALRAAIDDLIRLERYERRAWSRRKRAIREFVALRFDRHSRSSAA